MMSNQVSTKELFTNNLGQLMGNRMEDNAYSMGQSFSQMEFSQVSSEERYSQQPCSQPSESPSKRYYQRYMSKGPLFGRDSQSRSSSHGNKVASTKMPYHQQLQTQKAKAKERDERDLLDSIVLTVRGCAEDVKDAVEAVKESVNQGVLASENQLSTSLSKVQDELNTHYHRIIDTIKGRDEEKKRVSSLQEELAKKDATITRLQKELDELQLRKEENVIQALKETYTQQQELNRQQIHSLHQQHQQHLGEHQGKQEEQQRQIEVQLKQQEQLKKTQQKQMTELEKRVAEEFDINEERNKARHTELLQDLQQEMDTANERGRKSVETHIHQKLRQMEQEFEEQQRHLLQIQDERQEELYARQREELEECMRRQLQQENIGQQQQYLKEIQLLKQQQEEEKQRLTQFIVDKVEKLQEDHKRDTALLEQKLLNHENVKKQQEQEDLKRKHEKELEQLLNKHRQEKDVRHTTHEVSDGKLSMHTNASNHYNDLDALNSNIPVAVTSGTVVSDSNVRKGESAVYQTKPLFSQPSKSVAAFVSPLNDGRQWTSRSLFNRSNPSPVATVLPQVQTTVPTLQQGSTSNDSSETSHEVTSQQSDIEMQESPEIPLKQVPRRGGKRKAKFTSKKTGKKPSVSKSNKLKQNDNEDDNIPEAPTRITRQSKQASLISQNTSLPERARFLRQKIAQVGKTQRAQKSPSSMRSFVSTRPPMAVTSKQAKCLKGTRYSEDASLPERASFPRQKIAQAGKTKKAQKSPSSLRSFVSTRPPVSVMSKQAKCLQGTGDSEERANIYTFEDDVDTSPAINIKSTGARAAANSFWEEKVLGKRVGSESMQVTRFQKGLPRRNYSNTSYGLSCGMRTDMRSMVEPFNQAAHYNEEDSQTSTGSSPSISVIDVVIKRKIKTEKKTPPTHGVQMTATQQRGRVSFDHHAPDDFLCTPRLTSTGQDDTLEFEEVFHQQQFRRNSEKRKLYHSDDVTSEILQLTRTVKPKQLKFY